MEQAERALMVEPGCDDGGEELSGVDRLLEDKRRLVEALRAIVEDADDFGGEAAVHIALLNKARALLEEMGR